MDVRAVIEAGSPHKSCTLELQVDRHACASREYVSRVTAFGLIILAELFNVFSKISGLLRGRKLTVICKHYPYSCDVLLTIVIQSVIQCSECYQMLAIKSW